VYTINQDRDQFIISKLKNSFGSAIESWEMVGDMFCITVNKDRIAEIMFFLKDDRELNFNFLTTLCGMHYPEKEQLGVVYHIHSFAQNHRIRIKTTVPIGQPQIPTITSVWPAANWMEREAYDFFGIQFEGHPNMTRILNVEDMTAFPLRKDFPLEDQTREDKDDRMFGR
jgi:NADH-quinone oxidoreductase subunit C